jgi:hypothetical protein
MASVALIEFNGEKAVEKISRNVNYAMEHESIIGSTLNEYNCDNFVKFFKLVKSQTNGLPQLLTKFIEGPTMYQYFTNNEKFKTLDGCDEMTSLITRTLIAACIMNEECRIVHNDLHQDNVIVSSTTFDYEVYIFPDGKEYVFETYGKCPVLIDMDMAFIGGMQRLMIPTYTYKYGICCHDADPLADARRLLSGLNTYTESSKVLIDLLCLKDIFKELNLTRFGWHKQGIFPDVYSIIKKYAKENFCNIKVDSTTINLFTSHIQLPLKRIYVKPKVLSSHVFIQKLSHVEIKSILDGNDLTRLTHREMCIARIEFTYIIEILNDLVYDEAMKFSTIMYNQIEKCRVKCVRDIVNMVYKPISITEFKTVKVYDVEKRDNYYLKVSARDARQLNKNRITFKDLSRI